MFSKSIPKPHVLFTTQFFNVFSKIYKPNVESLLNAIQNHAIKWAVKLRKKYITLDELKSYRSPADDSNVLHFVLHLFWTIRYESKAKLKEITSFNELLVPDLLFHRNKHGYTPVDIVFSAYTSYP